MAASQGQHAADPRREAIYYEPQRPTWDSRQSPYQHHGNFQAQARPENRAPPTTQPSNFWDEEGSDSDVSRTIDINEPVNRIISPIATPRMFPQISSPHALESLELVQARLRDLDGTDDYNARKQEKLNAKRRRKDERIMQRRALEDEKIRAVYNARSRKDARISARRAREDEAFERANKQLEDQEFDLRRRLKRLKRGLPVEESPQNGRSASAASMSPSVHTHGVAVPPAKRHQSGPPGQNDSPNAGPSRPMQTAPPQPPQYQFYQPTNPPYSVPYHHGPQYAHGQYHPQAPAILSSTAASAGSPRPSSTAAEPPAPKVNGQSTSSPAPRAVQLAPPAHIVDQPKPQLPSNSSIYDTRPPAASTGFTSVNTPQPSGFATINARGPNYTTTPPSRPKKQTENPTQKNGEVGRGPGKSPSVTPTSVGGLSLNKRTPSTTHPYQMSEAFANRHHHCERTDELNRGIWTSHGPGGTREMPTGPPVEMYLRCNHDECRRIDWRTVHGLQCHIVKNHEQPKGTIGSLEKALDKYGVPVSEIAEYERVHGLGTAGQMADPKNLKIKNKTKEALQKTESPGSVKSNFSPPAFGPSSSYGSGVTPLGGPMFPHEVSRTPSSGVDRDGSEFSREPSDREQSRPFNPLQAARNAWPPEQHPTNNAVVKEDSEMRDAPGSLAPKRMVSPTLPETHRELSSDTIVTTPTQTLEGPTDIITDLPKPASGSVANTPLPAPLANASTATIQSPPKESNPLTSTDTQHVTHDIIQVEARQSANAPEIATPSQTQPETQEPQQQAPEFAPVVPPQPPPTPGRKASRRESVSVPKSAQKEPREMDGEVSSVQSPIMSKAESKRGGRRASVATTAGGPVDEVGRYDKDMERNSDNAEFKGDRDGGRTPSSRRNTNGRFLRKGR